MKEKSEQGNDGIFFGDADYRGVVWSITQTLFPRSLVPGQFKFIDLHPYALSSLPGRGDRRSHRNSWLLQHNRTEVVACLTMTEFNLFRNIRLREFLDKTWLTEQMSSLVYVMVSSPSLVDECPYPCSLLLLKSSVVLWIQGEPIQLRGLLGGDGDLFHAGSCHTANCA